MSKHRTVAYQTYGNMRKFYEVELRSPSFDRFSFLLYVHFYNFTDAGIWVSWNYPTETEHEAMGQRQRTEDHGKVIFASVFFFLLSYISHLSMHLEKSRRLSVLWTIWNFSMISSRKIARIIWFLSSPWSGFRQLKNRVQKRWPKVATNEECFSSEIWEIAVFLYNWPVSPGKLPDKTGTWKVEQKTTVARP